MMIGDVYPVNNVRFITMNPTLLWADKLGNVKG